MGPINWFRRLSVSRNLGGTKKIVAVKFRSLIMIYYHSSIQFVKVRLSFPKEIILFASMDALGKVQSCKLYKNTYINT